MIIAALADIHVRKDSAVHILDLLQRAMKEADVLVLCGDLTDTGMVEEAQVLRGVLEQLEKPVVAVLGNHDYESEQEKAIIETLRTKAIHVLDGDGVEIEGVGFAGVKGFVGGFGKFMLPKWGERLLKEMVDYGANQALLLERALAKLETERKIALMHYAPIAETLKGEPVEIQAFLGLTRLEGPLNRFGVTMAFHGHAHHGTHEGKTTGGTRVFNVSAPLLERLGMVASVHSVD